jgi:hypothetical protein
MFSVALVLVSLFLFLYKKRDHLILYRISWGHTCLEFVITSVYFNLIGPMKVSAKQITSSTHPLIRKKNALADHINTIPSICPLSRTISCCVHKPYAGNVAALGPRTVEETVLVWNSVPTIAPNTME